MTFWTCWIAVISRQRNSCLPFLARCRKNVTVMPMKLALAVLVYLVIGLVLSWGVLLLLAGKPWLFIVALLAYIVAFGKIGCTAP
jgi:hypothetical protein